MTFERALEIEMIFEKIHCQLSNLDKLSLQEATMHNRTIRANFDHKNRRKKAIICPACLLDIASNEIIWVPKRNIQPSLIGTMKLPIGNLILRSELEDWTKISNVPNPDKEEKVIKLKKYQEGMNFTIPGTNSTMNNVDAMEAANLFNVNYATMQIEEFNSTADFMRHFQMCHAVGAKMPKPKRKLSLTRENNKNIYKNWPLYDHSITSTFLDYRRLHFSKFYTLKTKTEEVRTYHKDFNSARLAQVIRNITFTEYITFFTHTPLLENKTMHETKYCNILYSLTILLRMYEHIAVIRGRYNPNISSEIHKNISHMILLNRYISRHCFSIFKKSVKDI